MKMQLSTSPGRKLHNNWEAFSERSPKIFQKENHLHPVQQIDRHGLNVPRHNWSKTKLQVTLAENSWAVERREGELESEPCKAPDARENPKETQSLWAQWEFSVRL